MTSTTLKTIQHWIGGWKRASFGDHNIYGPEAVRFYTRVKTSPPAGRPESRPAPISSCRR
jgi:hypothetical protein